MPRYFPPPESANEDGILGFTEGLSTGLLLDAYRHGIFPWPFWGNGEPIPWCSPDPRAVFEFDDIHISRRLLRTLRSGRFSATCDCEFESVMRACAESRQPESETWITGEMTAVYCQLHELGHAHSVEVWRESELVGGIYGVTVGALFAGESMFYRERDASKVALIHLAHHLESRGYLLFDIQQWTEHTGRMGAGEVSRDEYLRRLAEAVEVPVTFGDELIPWTTTDR